MIEYEIRELALNDLSKDLLNNFNRLQETERAWVKVDDIHLIDNISFKDDWDKSKKLKVIKSLRSCLNKGGFIVSAYVNNSLIAFASVEGTYFGTNNEYLELSFIHTTKELRSNGIGRELFYYCIEKAKVLGAKKLYIGAHPSVQTQKFYKSLGCTYAMEINPKILKREPLDIQLEKLII